MSIARIINSTFSDHICPCIWKHRNNPWLNLVVHPFNPSIQMAEPARIITSSRTSWSTEWDFVLPKQTNKNPPFLCLTVSYVLKSLSYVTAVYLYSFPDQLCPSFLSACFSYFLFIVVLCHISWQNLILLPNSILSGETPDVSSWIVLPFLVRSTLHMPDTDAHTVLLHWENWITNLLSLWM